MAMNELKFYHAEFEAEVRERLQIYDRAITEEDALTVRELDCSNFDFDGRDYEALSAFKNLIYLSTDTRADELGFLRELPLLEELEMVLWSWENAVDFRYFSHLLNLKSLFISGGDISDIAFKNLDGLTGLKSLRDIGLHEFGTVDLSPLCRMPWLTEVLCGYGDEVYGIEALSEISGLTSLKLTDIRLENLDFLDSFPDTLHLELWGITVKDGSGCGKLSRFVDGSFDDIEVRP